MPSTPPLGALDGKSAVRRYRLLQPVMANRIGSCKKFLATHRGVDSTSQSAARARVLRGRRVVTGRSAMGTSTTARAVGNDQAASRSERHLSSRGTTGA